MRDRVLRRTERDSWILESLGKLRFATTRQLADLHFAGSRWAANKRLRRLLDAELVRVWVRDLAADNIYALSGRGARLLGEEGGGEAGPAAARALDGNLDHLLLINDIRLALVRGLDQTGELAWWRSDWELRARFREGIVPDALFAIRWPDADQVFALEVDNQSRSGRGFLKKLVGYAGLQSRRMGLYGLREFVTLVVGRDGRWIERYRGLAGARGKAWHVWFSTLEAVSQGIDASIWTAPDGGVLSLRGIGSLPYGKEGFARETGVPTLHYATPTSTDILR